MQDIESNQQLIDTKKKECPYWAMTFPCILLVVSDVFVCRQFIDVKPVQWKYPIFCYGFAFLCMAWWLLLFISRLVQSGIGGYYDAYWFCNVALLLTAIGVAFKIPTLVGQSMCLLLLPHMTFWIDVSSYLICKKCPFNAYPYMFDKEIPFMEKFTSYHHFWYFPGLVLVLWKQPLFSLWSYGMSIILFAILQYLSHYMTPMIYEYEDGTTRYLNICLAHEYPEFGKTLIPFKYTLGKPFIVMFVVTILFYIVPANIAAYGLIIACQFLCNHYF